MLLALGALCAAVELVLQAADLGLIGSPRWRYLAWDFGAFWPGLLADWRPNYPAQPVVMFVSHSFLHASLWHLAGNLVALWLVGRHLVAEGRGALFLLGLWLASAVAGGLAFAALGTTTQPVIGASGPLFGYAGVWMAGLWRDQPRSIAGWVLGLVVLHLAWWALSGGRLAWQNHLGGFLLGWLCGLALPRARG